MAGGLIVAGAVAGDAAAGTYAVRQCEAGNSFNDFVWQTAGTVAGGQPSVVPANGSSCGGEFGLAVANNLGASSVTHAPGAFGGYFATPPAGTFFQEFSGYMGTLTAGNSTNMATYVQASYGSDGSPPVAWLLQGQLGNQSWDPPSGLGGPVGMSWGVGQAHRVGMYIQCSIGSGCVQAANATLRIRGRGFRFVMNDWVTPTVSDPGGSLLDGGWVRGVRGLSAGASDGGGGLTHISALFDLGGSLLTSPSSCTTVDGTYARLRPCPLERTEGWNVNTATLPDGQRSVTVYTHDAGGAHSQQTRTFNVDNTAPGAPQSISVDGGEGWRQSNGFTVRWQNPSGQHAPVARAHYELCPVQPAGPCTSNALPGGGIDSIVVSVPQPGEYRVRTWLEDAAGNVNSAAKSAWVTLWFDDVPPGQAGPERANGWLNALEALSYDQWIPLVDGGFQPVSGIRGYSVTADGSDPDATPEALGEVGQYRIEDLPEGITIVRARAVSGAGVGSATVGETEIKVDKSPPSTAVTGAPGPDAWSTAAVVLRVQGSDQPGLSGMAGAGAPAPIEEGGYTAYRVDGGPAQRARGPVATVPVSSDGRHTIAYEAFDAAGNPSGERSVFFKIDRTPPSPVVFEALDPGDPRRLAVAVSDATSGVAGGQIEIRRIGGEGFQPLATALEGGRLLAELDDELPRGRYELRARVRDVAGNEAVSSRRADGGAMVLDLPLRFDSRLEVAGGGGAKPTCRKRRKVRTKPRRRKTVRFDARASKRTRQPGKAPVRCRRKGSLAVGSAVPVLAHGKHVTVRGRVLTATGGPVAGAHVAVEGQASSGGPFVQLGAVRADADGGFVFTIPAGPSRTVRFGYAGTATVRPSSAVLQTRVRAAARLGVSRRRLRNGESVVFRGRLLGGSIPGAGKVVSLQARVGRQWRTFATPRADTSGRFRHRYRFTSTTGLRRYSFRAVVTREAAYPYEPVTTRAVAVVVRGR